MPQFDVDGSTYCLCSQQSSGAAPVPAAGCCLGSSLAQSCRTHTVCAQGSTPPSLPQELPQHHCAPARHPHSTSCFAGCCIRFPGSSMDIGNTKFKMNPAASFKSSSLFQHPQALSKPRPAETAPPFCLSMHIASFQKQKSKAHRKPLCAHRPGQPLSQLRSQTALFAVRSPAAPLGTGAQIYTEQRTGRPGVKPQPRIKPQPHRRAVLPPQPHPRSRFALTSLPRSRRCSPMLSDAARSYVNI